MVWDSAYKPRIRPVEAFPIPDGDGRTVGIRDASGLSDAVLTLSPAALHVLSMMDGSVTCEELGRNFLESFGKPLPVETLHSILEALEQAHLLESPAFEAFYESLVEAYRSEGARDMAHTAAVGITEDADEIFEKMLAAADPPVLPGPVRGLLAPHLDYRRGSPCYGAAYATLRDRPAPDRVIILGANHFGRSTSVVTTGKSFSTPLGITRTDMTFLEEMVVRCGDLRKHELDHAREHSVELQVLWLQHLFGADNFEIVPFLCPDPTGPTGTRPSDGRGVELGEFARELGEAVAADGRDTLFVAGVDLSHVGRAFGDDRTLDDAFLEEVRAHDRRMLGQLEPNDPQKFLACVNERGNHTRVCSAGCIYALATALFDATAVVLRYHQAVDQSSQNCVTCTAVAFI